MAQAGVGVLLRFKKDTEYQLPGSCGTFRIPMALILWCIRFHLRHKDEPNNNLPFLSITAEGDTATLQYAIVLSYNILLSRTSELLLDLERVR